MRHRLQKSAISSLPGPRSTVESHVTFKDLGNGKTEMTVTEYSMPATDTELGKNAELDLNQSPDSRVRAGALELRQL